MAVVRGYRESDLEGVRLIYGADEFAWSRLLERYPRMGAYLADEWSWYYTRFEPESLFVAEAALWTHVHSTPDRSTGDSYPRYAWLPLDAAAGYWMLRRAAGCSSRQRGGLSAISFMETRSDFGT